MTTINNASETMTSAATSPARMLAYLIACCSVWLAARPYEGITLDGQLYTLQALATLWPHPLGDDIFLRFGSQNDFTLFPRVVAALISHLGVEPAVALVTLTSALMLLAAGWLLARRLCSRELAWLSLGLLIVIPGWYGAATVFRYDEMYLSARVPAEAFAVIALVFACGKRWWSAVISLAIAMATHPVMAAPAAGVLVLLAIDNHSDRMLGDRTATIVALAGAILVVGAAVCIAPVKTPEHELWLETLRARTLYAFLQAWRLEDWIQNALSLATLAVAATSLESRIARRLTFLTLLVGLIGLVLGALASMASHFDALLLVQSWRWPWLGRLVAVALLPATVASLWKGDSASRASALLLGSGWALSDYSGGIVATAAAILWFARSQLYPPRDATALKGACIVAATAIVVLVVFAIQALPLEFDTNMGPIWVQRMTDVAGLTGPPMLLIAAAWYLSSFGRSWIGIVALGALALIFLGGALAYNYARVTEPRYSAANYARFSSWRHTIAPSAEVLWFEDPAAVWTLLERKSFLSVSQSAGLMYSPKAIPEFIRRGNSLSPLVSPGYWTLAQTRDGADSPKPMTLPILRLICRDRTLDFVVGSTPLDGHILRAEWPTRGLYVYLFDCDTFRTRTPL